MYKFASQEIGQTKQEKPGICIKLREIIKGMNYKRKHIFNFCNILNIFFLYICLKGIIVSILMNAENRSLWLDEAMLAWSFSRRSFWRLWDGTLEQVQSAPLGWLYIEKILTIVFGNTEFVLRSVSVGGVILTLAVLYYLLKKYHHAEFPFAACAFLVNMQFVLRYSNVFKPYMTDGFFVLFVILLFYWYEEKRISLKVLSLWWCGLIWFSNPVCFFMGGLLIAKGIFAVLEKDWKTIKEELVCGSSISCSFVIYYFFWLRETAVSNEMQSFWAGQNFPLFPKTMEDLGKMKDMLLEIFRHFGEKYEYLFLIMMVAMLIIAVIKKDKILIGCYFGLLITLFASSINMYPMEDRLWCFFYPLGTLICFIGLETLIPKGSNMKPEQIIVGFLMLSMVICNQGIKIYSDKNNVYWSGEELNPEIAYLEENIKEDEMVYVYKSSVSGFQYKNGYDNTSIGGYENNVIFGTTFFGENDDCGDEIHRIAGLDKFYIASSHVWDDRVKGLFDVLQGKGYLELITYDYNTPLWFYCSDMRDSKLQIRYEILEQSKKDGLINITLRIYNNGDAYLNHKYETVYLINQEDGSKIELPKNLKPGDYADIELQYTEGNNPSYSLENEYGVIFPKKLIVGI